MPQKSGPSSHRDHLERARASQIGGHGGAHEHAGRRTMRPPMRIERGDEGNTYRSGPPEPLSRSRQRRSNRRAREVAEAGKRTARTATTPWERRSGATQIESRSAAGERGRGQRRNERSHRAERRPSAHKAETGRNNRISPWELFCPG